MEKLEVIGVIDVGKTNKKLLLFNRRYEVVFEWTEKMPETVDEDGFACEDVSRLGSSILNLIDKAVSDDRFVISALHFATYGASFVYIDALGHPLTPLYNYLKPYPETLQKWFYNTYGNEAEMARITASPVLGSLNSGLQVLRLKHERPDVWDNVKYALHLPQYIGYLLHRKGFTDITSIGCHTQLWNFDEKCYHEWVVSEGVVEKFGPLTSCKHVERVELGGRLIPVGIGLHDSSAALIPYLRSFNDPFILISTGTWSISMNPFNHEPLTASELEADCLCYLQFNGQPVKASRLFMGRIHDESVAKLASHFGLFTHALATMPLDERYVQEANTYLETNLEVTIESLDYTTFSSAALAYHVLMILLVKEQIHQLNFVLNDAVVNIYVDGGFGKNPIFMYLLASALPTKKVYASEVAQATALGAALAIHDAWNSESTIEGLIHLVPF